ncbi:MULTISPECIES: hypothetical protein [unclassified Streptomyces]|uniref:hypothetical protein n=1 Tax=unclassified Streptomyces TaxID=2593676 RepID=UPI0006F9A344|nr:MULTISPECIES: hypothetical protein [unclassified Streptomyces]KQX57351.1 hypothetical protein ASD33_27010 [Streptomyces sp. Root1304]KRA98723.1 hypothetical protein ASE09_23820 [Streptomyces sp. Root66D1]
MPTPRHHLNRQRRRQALADQSAAAPATEEVGSRPSGGGRSRTPVALLTEPAPRTRTRPSAAPERAAADEPKGDAAKARPRPLVPLVVLCVLTLLLGGFAGLAYSRAEALRDDPVRGNTALTDLARTSEIKGQTAAAVAALFSYDHADTAPFERAGKTLLTGKAVAQHRTLLAGVLAKAAQRKSVITTVVTDSAVERIDDDRARVLVYADQSSVSTAGPGKAAGGKQPKAEDQGVYAGAMFAVDVVLRDGRWLIENIDTFGR